MFCTLTVMQTGNVATCRHVSLIHHRFMFFRHPPIGCYNVSDRAMSIYVKNSQSLLEYPKKNRAALHHFR